MEQDPQIHSILSRDNVPSPGRIVPFPVGELETFVFERLEYGKLCMTEDGPIEPSFERYPVATSEDFPASVEPSCRPWILGIGSEMAPGAPHGIVVRCVLVKGVPFQVFCRLRQRPERGEGQPGRCFWRGRYLCCRQGVPDPFTGFEALTDGDLLGITLSRAKEPWKPIRKAAQPPPQIDGPLDSFLQQALELVLSGIPVGIAGGIDESAFFRHAAALWFLLPPPLRVLFSAGWAVPPSEAASLHLSAAPQFPPSIAVFDRADRQWTLPARVDQIQANGELRSRPFGEDLLIPGRMFLRESFEWTPEGRARLGGLTPRLDHLEGFDYGIRTSKETTFVVDARSAWARECFRRPGLRSLDHARTVELESWLRGTWEGDPATLCLGTSQYFFPDARRQVFARGLAAMAQPETQSRGDEVVWSSLVEDESCRSFLDSEESAPSVFALVRSRLMRALAIRGWQAVLSALEAGIQQEAALDLPPDAVARLDAEMTDSLEDAGSLPYHVRLLQPLHVPEPYRAWAVARAARLAIALGTASHPTAESLPLQETLERLQKISTDQTVAVLLRLHLRKAPTQGDVIVLGALAPDDMDLLTRNLLALLYRRGEHTREEPEALFSWVRLDPLLQRAASSVPLLASLCPWPENATQKANLLQGVLREIQEDHIPESLEERVAAVALEYWDLYRKHYAEAAGSKPWHRLIAHWPPEAAFALVGIDITNQKRPPAPEIQNILRTLKLSCETLDALIADHVARRSQKEIVGMASKLLWKLCDHSPGGHGPLTTADLCRHLANGTLPDGHPIVPDEGKRALVIKLAHSIPGLEIPDTLWPQATHSWQIRFLLELTPGADLEPTPEQLSALIKERVWLRKHLTGYAKNAKRRQRFDIASKDFHELRFPKEGWKYEYQQGPFWAAFRSVPLKLQGSLRDALAAYSESPKEIPGYVITYLDGQLGRESLEPNAFEELLRRIARAAFAPYLKEGHLGARDLEAIFQYHERMKPSLFGPDVLLGPYDQPFAKPKAGDQIFVATEFKKLIEKVADLDGVKIVVAEVRRVLEK